MIMSFRFNIIPIFLLITTTLLFAKHSTAEEAIQKYSHQKEYRRIAQLRKVLLNPRKSQNEKIQAQFDIGRLYFKTKDYQSALTEYNALVNKLKNKATRKNISSFANVYYHRGLTYYKLTQYSMAIVDCRMALSKNPKQEVQQHARYILGMSYRQLKNYAAAERAFLLLLSGKSKRAGGEILASAHLQLGHLYLERKNYSEAANKYEIAAKQLSDNSDRLKAIEGAAYSYLQLKDYQLAKRWYDRLVASTDSSDFLAIGNLALGDISALNQKWAMASQYYQAAKKHADFIGKDKTQRGEISFKLGESLYQRGKYKAAREALNIALQMQKSTAPHSKAPTVGASWTIDATYRLGECHYKLKDYEDSISAYQNAVAGYEGAIEGLTDDEIASQAQKRIARAYLQSAKAQMQTASNDMDIEEAMRTFQRAHSASQLIDDEELRSTLTNQALYGEAECALKLGKRDMSQDTVRKLADSASDSGDIEGILNAADFLFDAEDYEGAAEVYEELAYIEPATPEQLEQKTHALLQLGFCNIKRSQSEPENAERLQKAALRAYSLLLTDEYIQHDNLGELVNRARYQKALIHNSLGEYEEAERLLSTAIKFDETGDIKSKGYLTLAHIYEKLSKYDNAIEAYEEAAQKLTEEQDRTFVHQHLGELYRKRGRHDDAIRHYQELAKVGAKQRIRASPLYFMGWCYANKLDPDFDAAAKAYRKIIENHSSSEFAPDAYWNLVQILSEAGQHKEAFALCEDIASKYSSSQDEHVSEIVNAARNFISNTRLVGAKQRLGLSAKRIETIRASPLHVETYEDIIASSTTTLEDRAKAYLGLGNLYTQNGDITSALGAYEKAKNDLKNLEDTEHLQADIAYREAYAYQQLGEYEKAISAAEKSLALNPNGETRFGDYYAMGVSYEELNQLEKARNAFEYLLAQNQTPAQVTSNSYFHLGNIYSKERQNQRALLAYQQAAQTSESKHGKIESYRMMAHLYEPEEVENAIDAWGYVLSNSGDSEEFAFQVAEALYKRGLLYVRQKDYSGAIADFERLIDAYDGRGDVDIQKMVSDVRLRLPDIIERTGNLSLALSKAEAAENIAKAEGNPDILAQIQYQIASFYHKQAQECKPKSRTHRRLAKQAKVYYERARQNAISSGLSVALFLSEKPRLSHPKTDEKIQQLIKLTAFQSGQLAYQTDDFKSAISSMESFIKEYPDDEKNADAHNYLAWAYYRSTETQRKDTTLFIKSANTFEKAVADFPNDKRAPEWLYQAGAALKEANLIDKSIAVYRNLVETHPEHKLAAGALYAIAGELYDVQQYDAAIKTHQELLSKYPKSDWADESAFAIGNCYHKLGQHEKSIETYQSLAKEFPRSPLAARAQTNIATHHFNNKDYAQALTEYKKLTKTNFPNIEKRLLNNANRSIREIENILSEPIYHKASGILNEAENKQISQVQRKGYAKRAINLFSQISEKYPQSKYIAYATVSTGAAYEILEQWEDATSSYEKIVKQYGTTQQGETAKLVNYAQKRIKAIQHYLPFRE